MSQHGLAVDAAGDVYVADTGNNRVVELAAGASSPTVLPFTGLNGPNGIAVDAAGDVFVADLGNDRVVELTPEDKYEVVLPFTSRFIVAPHSVAVDAAGDVYVEHGAPPNSFVGVEELVVGTSTQPATQVGLHIAGSLGIAVDAAGDVYLFDSNYDEVVELAAGASSPTVLPFTGLNHPNGIAVDAAGDVYVADTGNNRVVELAAGASSQTVLPFTGLSEPTGVAVDAAGDVYITDADNVLELPELSAIAFTAPTAAVYGGSATLTATGHPGAAPVVFSVDETSGAGVCAVSGANGSTVTYTKVGLCVLDANQAASDGYQVAAQAQSSVQVSPAALTVTVQPSTRLYGQPDPAFTVAYTGLTNGDTAAAITAKLHLTFTAKMRDGTPSSTTSPVGTYKVRVTGRTSALPNYAITYVAGTMTVTNNPHVTAVSPNSGPTTGGTAITITGTQFTTGDTVVIGQSNGTNAPYIAATNVVIVSPTEITAVTGGNAKPGTFLVFVITNTGAHSPTTDKVHFTYTKPTS